MKKRVTFNETKNTFLNMHVWSFAYKEARKGPWEECARDRVRFKKKIETDFEPILTKILTLDHRQRIYTILSGG